MTQAPETPADDEARFEAMLREVLTTGEEAHGHRSAKDRRTVARYRAVGARERFARNRDRGVKFPRPVPGSRR